MTSQICLLGTRKCRIPFCPLLYMSEIPLYKHLLKTIFYLRGSKLLVTCWNQSTNISPTKCLKTVKIHRITRISRFFLKTQLWQPWDSIRLYRHLNSASSLLFLEERTCICCSLEHPNMLGLTDLTCTLPPWPLKLFEIVNLH